MRDLKYAEPDEVVHYLNVTSSTLTDHDLKGVLINAMTRITRIEAALARAAGEASLLKHLIVPPNP